MFPFWRWSLQAKGILGSLAGLLPPSLTGRQKEKGHGQKVGRKRCTLGYSAVATTPKLPQKQVPRKSGSKLE